MLYWRSVESWKLSHCHPHILCAVGKSPLFSWGYAARWQILEKIASLFSLIIGASWIFWKFFFWEWDNGHALLLHQRFINQCMLFSISFVTLRTSEIHLFYNLQLFYWHFLEILWLFIFLVFYKMLTKCKIIRNCCNFRSVNFIVNGTTIRNECYPDQAYVLSQLLCAWRLIPRLETNERECWKFLETGGWTQIMIREYTVNLPVQDSNHCSFHVSSLLCQIAMKIQDLFRSWRKG